MNLVVGATGSLGSHIALRLLRSDQPVRAMVRESSQYSQLQSAGAQIALGDLKNRRSLERACVGVRRLIATATAAARGGKDTIESVDREGYENLIAAADAAGVKQFVFLSAHGFQADSPNELARAKVATEVALRDSRLNYTILRPALFMESWIGRILGAQLKAGPRIVVMGEADRELPYVSAINVADLAIAALDHPDAQRASIALATQTVSYRQLIEWISVASNREIELVSVPPGTSIPGLPKVIVDLWTMLSTTGIPPLETVGVAVNFGLKLEPIKAFIERTFGTPSSSI